MTKRAMTPALAGLVLCLVAVVVPALSAPAGAAAQVLRCNGKVATIVGTPEKDRIIGTDGDDVIVALGGADVIYGGGGRDTICGGDGPDKIYGGRQSDVIFGEQGNDRIAGEAGADVLAGGRGRDVVIGGAGNDAITGNGGGDRRLKGNDGTDSTNGGSGTDRCEVDASDSSLARCEVDIDGRPIGADPPPDDPDVARIYEIVEDEILPEYGGANPWVGIAWQFIKTNGVIEAGPDNSGGFVQTECRFFSNELATCNAVNMTIGRTNFNQTEVILHELAHVYEQTTALAGNRSAMGIALLYIEETYPATECPAAELLADVMVRTAMPDSVAPYWRFNCGSVPNDPTAADLDVVRDALADVDHQWFANTFANGEQAWTALFSHDTRSEVATALADKFGGYCSAHHTNQVLYYGRSDSNPFTDGGC